MFLTQKEIFELTGRKRRPAQRRVLSSMGITHRVRPDGACLVMKSHIEKQFDGGNIKKESSATEPNWDAIQ